MTEDLNQAINAATSRAARKIETVAYKGWIQGPKSAKLPEFLRILAMQCRIEIAVTTEKRWINETVFYTVKGQRNRVEVFEKVLNDTLHEHNA